MERAQGKSLQFHVKHSVSWQIANSPCLPAWWRVWDGKGVDQTGFHSTCSESFKLSLESRCDASSMTLWTSAILLSRCNHFLVISSSPLECSTGMWSQTLWETQDPLHQILNLHLEYVILFPNTFNGLLLPSTFILRRRGLLKSPHKIVMIIWCPSNRIDLLGWEDWGSPFFADSFREEE